MEAVAFFGAGNLGAAMVRNLRRRGVPVHVWSRTAAKAAALAADGAIAFTDPARAAEGAQRVHLCLNDDASVDAVLELALPGIAPGVPIADHTTLLPQRVAERVARLNASGHCLLHAPVFMGPPMALDARGVMLASGDASLFARLREALAQMCSDLRYLGDRPDLAAVYKLMGNAMILTVVGGLNDVLRIAEQQGLTREQAFELFDFYDPSGQIHGRGRRMVAGDYDSMWSVDMAHKDASLMQGAAKHERLPVVDAVEAMLRAVSDRGLGDLDLAAIAKR